ncbi:unnamed protein product [Miscanthus lutarioriparius]|uniref:Uncharacterized protein n=1 Tax=Miscanthus lutarioriparius TaxID=422564 RepID=A0A811NBJ0_9POAL|nr:unnamed protein product [Miscanthus lutarioriparius]
MAAEHPKENSDASYPFLLPLESIDDEEIHSDTFYKKQKIRSESGTYVTTRVKENDVPIKCPMLESKCSFLELDMCHNIVTEDIIKKWGILLEDSTFRLSNQDKFNTNSFHGTSEENEILLMNLARRNRWKICPNCNFCIEKVPFKK